MKKFLVKIKNPLTRSIIEQEVEAINYHGAVRACHSLLSSGPFSVDSVEEIELIEEPKEELVEEPKEELVEEPKEELEDTMD